MTQQQLDGKLKNFYCDKIQDFLSKDMGEEVYKVPLSEESNSSGYQFAFPVVDEEGNEKTVLVCIKIPRKNREGKEYDLYEENARFLENCERAKEKKERASRRKKRNT